MDEEAWIDGLRMPPRKAPDPTPVGPVLVRIHYREAELRETVKAAGGQWQPQEKLWKVPYETVIKLGLDKRIIQFVMQPGVRREAAHWQNDTFLRQERGPSQRRSETKDGAVISAGPSGTLIGQTRGTLWSLELAV